MESTIGIIISVLLLLALVFALIVSIGKNILAFIEATAFYLLKKPVFIHSFNNGRKLNIQQENVLYNFSKYYRLLPEDKKSVFSYRVRKFMADKEFTGRQGLTVTDEMKLLISATAVKMTFGFRKFLINRFHTFIIYPDAYFSLATNTKNKGETNTKGVIVFSWKDFLFGFEILDDSINLGFHEFAHAVYVDEKAHHRNPCFNYYYEKWERILRDGKTIRKIRENKIFRAYATSNQNEFFAVALENFFENPDSFEKELPELFNTLCLMLNQRPQKL